MTNLAGQTFISYKSEQEATAVALKKSLHEHGIRTWQDRDDLGTEPTNTELREVIRSNGITDAIIVVSEKIKYSDTILDVEVPEIADKDYRNDEFSFVIAIDPSLTVSNEEKSIYKMVAEILDEADTNFGNFRIRNMKKITGEGSSPRDCDAVAKAVLENRLDHIDQSLSDGESLQCSLDTYNVTHPEKPMIKMDWTHHFGETLPPEDTWNDRFVPVLDSVVETVHSIMP